MRINLILSGLGSLRVLPQLFSGTEPGNCAHVIALPNASAHSAEVLAEYLREELSLPVILPEGDVDLEKGCVYVMTPGLLFAFATPTRMHLLPATDPVFPLDVLLESAARACEDPAVVVLSGLFTPSEGFKGLQALAARGAPFVGPPAENSSVPDILEELKTLGFPLNIHPLRSLLAPSKNTKE